MFLKSIISCLAQQTTIWICIGGKKNLTCLYIKSRFSNSCFSTSVVTLFNCLQVIAVVIQLILVFPIVVLPIIPLLGGSEVWNQRAVIFFLVFFCLLTSIALLPTGAENPGCWQNFVRY